MSILVTGGAGFIGSHVIQALQSLGHSVVNIDEVNDYYYPEYKRENLALLDKHPFYEIDFCDAAAVDEVFSQHQFDCIVHLGARAGIRPSLVQPDLYTKVNVFGTTVLLNAAIKYHVPQFIFGSSSSVYGNTTPLPFNELAAVHDPVSPYAATKLAAEQIARSYHEQYGLATTILRFFTVYGERGRPDMAPYLFTEAVLTGQSIKKFGDGSSSRDYTYIADIVAGIVAAVQRPFPFEIINLGNHQAVSLNEFISTLEQITGKTAQLEQLPPQSGDVDHTLADITKAQKLLGYKPITSLSVGLERFVDWYYKERL
ncbi:MAG: hypothetical protein ACD_43C00272G0013 [uncultured bacterium]|nr:MAG: hypothetical protein ACD_43C00272G0013 [uncultured bacterium]